MSKVPDFIFTAEYIPNTLYFGVVKQGKVLQSTKTTLYFNIDQELVYDNYFSDFGPLNLGCIYKYCKMVNEKIKHNSNFGHKIVHYTTNDPKKKANAAFLIGCYGVLYLNRTPKDALKPLINRGQYYKPFQDATPGESPFTITLMDCLQAIKKAKELSLFNFQDFDFEEYEKYDRIEGGDLNWIIPGKFLAFIGPVDATLSLYHPPEMYLDYFLQHNVKIVIRLNKRLYDAKVFVSNGIMHYDLFFPDGTCPPRHILMKFFHISEEASCAIGVHCKAGLGRTGSLIGCYLIKHYRMSAHEAIGWMRICRPGSVIGQQQGWLEKMETWLLRQGEFFRKRNYLDSTKLPIHKFGIYSLTEKIVKRRIFTKSPSPPSFSYSVSPSNRPRSPSVARRSTTIRMREDAESTKKIPKDPSDWRMIITNKSPSRDGSAVQIKNKLSKNTYGAGEPKTSIGRSHYSPDTGWKSITSKPCESGRKTWQDCHLATFRASQVPMIKTVNDAKQFLMNNNSYVRKVKEKERNLKSSLITKSGYTTAEKTSEVSHTPRNFQYKRRLGRSPSPPVRGPCEYSRGTNTSIDLDFEFLDSTTCMQEALSRLKLNPPRDGSTGASSLGARREAPPGKQAPSVRSDERSTATQGDVLNSIKFQRNFLNSFRGSDHCVDNKKKSKDKPNGDGSKLELRENCNRMFYTNRPTSSKPRRMSNNYFQK